MLWPMVAVLVGSHSSLSLGFEILISICVCRLIVVPLDDKLLDKLEVGETSIAEKSQL